MTATLDPANPYAAASDLPHALPPFDRLRPEHHLPALRAGMAAQRAEVEAVLATDEVTFENTVEALERSGQLLARALLAFSSLVATDSTQELREVDAVLAPELAAHADAITLDPRLFGRLEALAERRDELGLDGEALRLLERLHTDAVRAGARLDPDGTDELRRINSELSSLTTAFGTHLLAETNDLAVHVTDAAELAGLDDDQVASAAQAARARGVAGWVLPLVLPTDQPLLADAEDRGLRERLFTASTTRGCRGGEHDTRALVVRIAALRAQRAQLLGFADHASWVAADSTAGSLEAVDELLAAVAPPAVANLVAQAAELAAVLEQSGQAGPLRPWDWAWAARRASATRFAVDPEALRPWFALDAVLVDGVFAAAHALYGVTLVERTDLPLHHPDVRAWDVVGEEGQVLGLFLGDYFARESKRGGAWMTDLVTQSHLLGQRPVVLNVLNVPAPGDGGVALLTPDEVETTFHEFGHALHSLLSDVRYPRLAGTSVPRDFVEFPSQVNEMWAWEDELLARYARHHVTGEPLPAAAADALVASRAAGQAFATTEIVAAMLLDQAWHQLTPEQAEALGPQDVEAFEARALASAGVAVDLVPPRYRSTYFNHVFAGGYSAAYYSYLWSEVLDADTVEWFREQGGLVREAGRRFAAELLSRGGAVDPMEAYAAFRGRPPRVEPLLERRGLTPTG